MIDINNIYIDIDVNYYIEEIKKDLANKQFISALAIALMLPNICAKLENPEIDKIHKEKYVKWFNRWVYRKYYSHPNNKEIRRSKVKNPNLFKIKIDGDLCYALRCSFLHSGDDKIKISEILCLCSILFRHIKMIKLCILKDSYEQILKDYTKSFLLTNIRIRTTI